MIDIDMQEKLLEQACKNVGLEAYNKLIRKKSDLHTKAEQLVDGYRNGAIVVKSSFMYCHGLDMCFFYNTNGIAMMTFSGTTYNKHHDMIDNNLIKAFTMARTLLEEMQRLADEVQSNA